MNYIIRKREIEDCEGIAKVITIAWNETYKGIVSEEFLKNLYINESERKNKYIKEFDDNYNHYFVLEIENKIVGFIRVGESDEFKGYGEIKKLYIINGYKGYGFGKKLFETGIKELKKMKYDKVIVGCLDGNPSNEFYKHLGGKFLKTRIYKPANVLENVYVFEKI